MVTKRKILDILTDVVGVCGFLTAISALAMNMIPVQYAAQAIAFFAAVAVAGSAIKKFIDIVQGIPVDPDAPIFTPDVPVVPVEEDPTVPVEDDTA